MDSILKGDWVLVTSEELEKPYDYMEGNIYKVEYPSENGSVQVMTDTEMVELLEGEFEKVTVIMPRGR